MMPELGKYAEAVLSSYAVSLLLLLVLTVASIRRARRVRKELQDFEGRAKRNG